VCLAPGSRSTPLALAFAAQPAIRVYRHLDERSAGFFALGLALATGRPVALLCTSGTAAANFHPAVIEAYYAAVPLLVLTADRPPELRDSGANQTIDQVKMFGDHVRWAVDAPVPQADAPDVVLRHLRTLAARALAAAAGPPRGPVHVNLPFRKPLEPDAATPADRPAVVATARPPHTQISRGRLLPTDNQLATVAALAGQRGLIICGPGCPGGDFPAAVTALAARLGWPILADPLSGLRHGAHVAGGVVLGGYPLWLPALGRPQPRPDAVLRFGAVPTSASLSAWLERIAPPAHVHVRDDGLWADDLHVTHTFIQADPALFCIRLAAMLDGPPATRGVWASFFQQIETATWAAVDQTMADMPLFDGGAIARSLAALPDDAVVFAGNSMPVRYVDAFDRPDGRAIAIYGNRGASGIDGNVSTALGLAAAGGRPVYAFLGDITFYHDMNGLLAARQHGLTDVTFVVTNNDGGGIFRRLPIARHDPPFTDLFLTPHGLTFGHAAALYGLEYTAVRDTAELKRALADDRPPTAARLIEVMTDGATDYERHRAVLAAVSQEISSADWAVSADFQSLAWPQQSAKSIQSADQ
jgi:2-succinyl-5-enolpyruvyl-6-hydroxy-3-cyclohexene-1-carboxylate synthase